MRKLKRGQTVDVRQAAGAFYPATVLRVAQRKVQVSYPPRGKVAWVPLNRIRR